MNSAYYSSQNPRVVFVAGAFCVGSTPITLGAGHIRLYVCLAPKVIGIKFGGCENLGHYNAIGQNFCPALMESERHFALFFAIGLTFFALIMLGPSPDSSAPRIKFVMAISHGPL